MAVDFVVLEGWLQFSFVFAGELPKPVAKQAVFVFVGQVVSFAVQEFYSSSSRSQPQLFLSW